MVAFVGMIQSLLESRGGQSGNLRGPQPRPQPRARGDSWKTLSYESQKGVAEAVFVHEALQSLNQLSTAQGVTGPCLDILGRSQRRCQGVCELFHNTLASRRFAPLARVIGARSGAPA